MTKWMLLLLTLSACSAQVEPATDAECVYSQGDACYQCDASCSAAQLEHCCPTAAPESVICYDADEHPVPCK